MDETKDRDITLRTGDSDRIESFTAAEQFAPIKTEQLAVSGPKVPRCTLLEAIAQGASGTVYKARRDEDNTLAAVKVFNKELVPNPDAQRRFQQEIATLSQLSHPGIVKVLDYGTTEELSPFIAMELVDGVSIRTALDSEGVFEPKRAVLIAREICRALAVAHSQHIVHRDLKPNNIIVDGKNIAKVIDFGIAKAIGSCGDTITQYGSVIGTPAYMSPEQCMGESVDARSDIYSLGCTLFEMLTGMKAFDSATPVEAIARQISPDRSHIARKLKSTGAPNDLQRIIAKCLERQPDQRYRNVSELDHDLSAYLVGLPPSFTNAVYLPLQITLLCGIAIVGTFLATYLWLNSSNGQQQYPHQQIIQSRDFPPRPIGGPGIEIHDRSGRTLFTDPTAATLRMAIEDASEHKINLSDANLRDANLVGVSISSLDMSHADLTGARLTGAKLTDLDLRGAVLTGANLIQAKLLGVNLSDAQLNSSKMIQMKAPATILTGADLSHSDMTQSNLERASCKNTNFSYARLIQMNLEDADCAGANFDNANMNQVRMKGSRLARASFKGVGPNHVNLSETDTYGADLGGLHISPTGLLQ